MFAYIGGIVRNNKSALLAANGAANHLHLLVSLGKTIALSELVGDIKRDSSKWLKTNGAEFANFHWQDGYGAFSVGQTQIEEVKKYIANQKKNTLNKISKQNFADFWKDTESHTTSDTFGIEGDNGQIFLLSLVVLKFFLRLNQ